MPSAWELVRLGSVRVEGFNESLHVVYMNVLTRSAYQIIFSPCSYYYAISSFKIRSNVPRKILHLDFYQPSLPV